MFGNLLKGMGLFGTSIGRKILDNQSADKMNEFLKLGKKDRKDFYKKNKDSEDWIFFMEDIQEWYEKALRYEEQKGNEGTYTWELDLCSEFFGTWKAVANDKGEREALKDHLDALNSFGGFIRDSTSRVQDPHLHIYFPEDYDKDLPRTGGWIMPVFDGYNDHFQVERFGVYFAKPVYKKEEFEVNHHGKLQARSLKAKIYTNAGEIMLYPYEYIRIKDIQDVLVDVGRVYEMVQLGGGANFNEHKVHYLGTRGVDMTAVYMMLLNSINSMDFCYFKLMPDYVEYYTFYMDCLDRSIRPELIDRLWHCKQTGKPLFNIKEVKHEDIAEGCQDQKESDPTGHPPADEARESSSPAGS